MHTGTKAPQCPTFVYFTWMNVTDLTTKKARSAWTSPGLGRRASGSQSLRRQCRLCLENALDSNQPCPVFREER